ncbi:hypothetical protein [Ornithinibacillus scapharcae]|uniref:hypothetical protein n=1 Tax=Ornithinibacillus scapharcae TaxID=1147159 RepID=UPI000225B2DA|nr:hypothetical protein [Ornithinibacillus scapharcae]
MDFAKLPDEVHESERELYYFKVLTGANEMIYSASVGLKPYPNTFFIEGFARELVKSDDMDCRKAGQSLLNAIRLMERTKKNNGTIKPSQEKQIYQTLEVFRKCGYRYAAKKVEEMREQNGV